MNVHAFLQTLPYMGMGMLGIFIVTGLMILSIAVLNKATAPRKKDEDK